MHGIWRDGMLSGVLYAVTKNFHVLACHLGGIVLVKHMSQQALPLGGLFISGRCLMRFGIG